VVAFGPALMRVDHMNSVFPVADVGPSYRLGGPVPSYCFYAHAHRWQRLALSVRFGRGGMFRQSPMRASESARPARPIFIGLSLRSLIEILNGTQKFAIRT
jgi:hypothetical protein